MKKTFHSLLAGLVVACGPLTADFETGDYSQSHIIPPQAEDDRGPFTVEISYDAIGKSHFTRHSIKHQKIGWSEGEAEIDMVFYYDKCRNEGLVAGFSYNWAHLDWGQNPSFHQETFKTLTLSLSAFSERICGWLWKAQVNGNIDADHMNFNEYLDWDLLLWGRYNYCDELGFNVGFVAQTGMKIDHVYPILGIDWQYNDDWKINAVFPVNISAIYTIDCNWSIDIAARFFDSRYRTGDHAALEKALLHYRNWGAEVGLNYALKSWLTANVHVGHTFGGKLRISNQHNKHPHHFKFEGAGYAGGELQLHF